MTSVAAAAFFNRHLPNHERPVSDLRIDIA
jgi:hypothetical protein